MYSRQQTSFRMAMRFGRLVEEISSTKATYHCGEVDESRYVKRDTLKALKVKDEALALTLLSEAVKRGVNKKKYNIMINAKENG